MKIWIGYDPRDHDAFRVARQSILEWSSIDVDIRPLYEWELRGLGHYWRSYRVDQKGQMWDDRDGRPFSTQFSFTRFAVPLLEGYSDEWVLFMDADMMFRADIAELVSMIDNTKAVMCVKHNHVAKDGDIKMDGVLQTSYSRKNWSSFMLMRPSRCRSLTPYVVNNSTGNQLHAMTWLRDEEIGSLPKEWNWLAGYDPDDGSPKNVHFTLGTPDMRHAAPTPWGADWWDCLDRANKGVKDAKA